MEKNTSMIRVPQIDKEKKELMRLSSSSIIFLMRWDEMRWEIDDGFLPITNSSFKPSGSTAMYVVLTAVIF
jgi:hypothetical protein